MARARVSRKVQMDDKLKRGFASLVKYIQGAFKRDPNIDAVAIPKKYTKGIDNKTMKFFRMEFVDDYLVIPAQEAIALALALHDLLTGKLGTGEEKKSGGR